MRAPRFLPVPLADRRERARHRTLLGALAMALGSAATPVTLALLPLVVARTWRAHMRGPALLAVAAGLFCGMKWIDLAALAAFPAILTGPWIASLVGASAASAAWAASGRRHARDLMHAAAALALVASPWSPLPGLLLALGCWLAAPARRALTAANDNHPGSRPAYQISDVIYPPPRSARPAAYD